MKTSFSNVDAFKHQTHFSIQKCHALLDDMMLKRRPRHGRRRPVSSANFHDKLDLPLLVPIFKPETIRTDQENKRLLCLLLAFEGSLGEGPVNFSDRTSMVWDSGASIALTPHKHDFIGPI